VFRVSCFVFRGSYFVFLVFGFEIWSGGSGAGSGREVWGALFVQGVRLGVHCFMSRVLGFMFRV